MNLTFPGPIEGRTFTDAGDFEAWRTVSPVHHLRSKVKGGHDIKRLVLLAKTLAEAEAEIDLRTATKPRWQELRPYKDEGQMRIE